MAHGVHPAVKRVELFCRHSSRNGARAQADREQLIAADHPVLRAGQAPDGGVGAKVASYCPLSGRNEATLAHAPNRDAKNATEPTLSMPIFEHHSPNTLMTNRLSRPPSNSA